MTTKKQKNLYRAFYRNKEIDTQASTSFEAQKLAAAYFKTKKRHEITVKIIVRGDGTPVTHIPLF